MITVNPVLFENWQRNVAILHAHLLNELPYAVLAEEYNISRKKVKTGIRNVLEVIVLNKLGWPKDGNWNEHTIMQARLWMEPFTHKNEIYALLEQYDRHKIIENQMTKEDKERYYRQQGPGALMDFIAAGLNASLPSLMRFSQAQKDKLQVTANEINQTALNIAKNIEEIECMIRHIHNITPDEYISKSMLQIQLDYWRNIREQYRKEINGDN